MGVYLRVYPRKSAETPNRIHSRFFNLRGKKTHSLSVLVMSPNRKNRSTSSRLVIIF